MFDVCVRILRLGSLSHRYCHALRALATSQGSFFIVSACVDAISLHYFYEGFGTLTIDFCRKEATMMDLVYVAVLVGFFAASVVLVHGCQHLMGRRS